MYLIVYIVAFELGTWKKLEPIQEIHTFHILFDFPMLLKREIQPIFDSNKNPQQFKVTELQSLLISVKV